MRPPHRRRAAKGQETGGRNPAARIRAAANADAAPTSRRKPPHERLGAVHSSTDYLTVNHNAGAGTRILIDQLLAGARPPGYGNQPRSHNAIAAAVAHGRADWGLAIASVACLYGLGFLPIAPECFDSLLIERRRDRQAVQAFLAALADPAVRERIAALGATPV